MLFGWGWHQLWGVSTAVNWQPMERVRVQLSWELVDNIESRIGYEFLKDPSGTIEVTSDPEHCKLAREFRHHFGPSDPEP